MFNPGQGQRASEEQEVWVLVPDLLLAHSVTLNELSGPQFPHLGTV